MKYEIYPSHCWHPLSENSLFGIHDRHTIMFHGAHVSQFQSSQYSSHDCKDGASLLLWKGILGSGLIIRWSSAYLLNAASTWSIHTQLLLLNSITLHYKERQNCFFFWESFWLHDNVRWAKNSLVLEWYLSLPGNPKEMIKIHSTT